MTEQEKQIIEEMAVTIANFRIQICKIGNCKTCINRIDSNKECCFIKQAKAIYNAGYRKERQGEWKYNRNPAPNEKSYYCSLCVQGESDYGIDKYCPNCGAKMKGAE